jgi:hypothetical protein
MLALRSALALNLSALVAISVLHRVQPESGNPGATEGNPGARVKRCF